MTIHIGTSGWSYDHWSDVLYPPGAPSHERLRYYTQSFQTVELNSSFYRWPRLATFRAWKRRLPGAFRFSVKAPRGLTHAKKLYARRRLGSSGSPPVGTSWLTSAPYFLCSWDPTWLETTPGSVTSSNCYRNGSRHRSSFAIRVGPMNMCSRCSSTTRSRTASEWRAPPVCASSHRAVRVRPPARPHPHYLYAGFYPIQDLRWWAERLHEWDAAAKDVFVYFNNDGHGNAMRNALALRQLLSC
jgi:uncharacterized protein YecE (DUF72 family)